MHYWWVNHKQTSRQELEGGYIWSPRSNDNGSRNETYLNLTRMERLDTVFSYADGRIGAVGTVETSYRESERPSDFGKAGEQWNNKGWLVPIRWTRLRTPVRPKEHLDDIAPQLPAKYSPIRPDGNGNQKCYLAQINVRLGEILLRLADDVAPKLKDRIADVREAILADQEELLICQLEVPVTEKEQLVKSRRGQGVFRQRVEALEARCRITQTSDPRFLIAGHIKPWRLCDNYERLDGHNGLLLAPHIDLLFDKGWVSFSDEGAVLCADDEIEALFVRWGVDSKLNVGGFHAKQLKYLAFHREHIYRSPQKP